MRAMQRKVLAALAALPRNVWGALYREGYPGYPDTDLKRSTLITGNLLLHLHPVKVRRHALKFGYTFCLGGTAFLLSLVLTVTGVILMFYYHPSVPKAYYDMEDLEFIVNFGLLLRNLHRWSAHGMVAVVFLHMCRVFYTGAYKPPRELNWVVGAALLGLTLMLSFTGYLLPWDQLAFWAITVGTKIAKAVPLVGPQLRFLLLGGNLVGPNALLRFYVLHCVVLPLTLGALMALHFWKVRKDGGLSGPL